MSEEPQTYAGIVTRTFYVSPEAPFTTGILRVDGGQTVRFAGKVLANTGDMLRITGEWGTHAKYGAQFQVTSGVVKMDTSPDALITLLSTHKEFAGLGPVRSKKLAQAVLELSVDGDIGESLRLHTAEIAERAVISIEIVDNANRVWNERADYYNAVAALGEQGWSGAQAARIIACIGNNAAAEVAGDPYALIGVVPRFGFRTVDAVALSMGTANDDPRRLMSGVAFCLDRIAEDGNTWTTRGSLLTQSIEELQPDEISTETEIAKAIERMIGLGMIATFTTNENIEIVANAKLAQIEFEVFERILSDLATVTRDIETGAVNFKGSRTQAALVTLNKGQTDAAWGTWTHRTSVISGPGGVGKTYLTRTICEMAEENGMVVSLCAPTGKAARKLQHATGRTAKTIHRLLEPHYDPDTGGFHFKRDAGFLLGADIVLCDETSMVDIRLMWALLQAIGPETRLVLIGDHHQIPSVGPGAILRDILAGRAEYPGAVHVLTKIVRQAGDLARNTTALLDGIVVKENGPTWGIQKATRGTEEAMAESVAHLVEAVVTAPEPLQPFGRFLDLAWDIQVLAPMRKGALGTWALNTHLQALRQRMIGNPAPDPPALGKPSKPLIGDRVIWTKNDYKLDLFNGTQAIVIGLPSGGAVKLLTEDGREVLIPGSKRINVELAYALTIHKSQGSEWPMVILIASSLHWHMHDSALLYTGASRAAESLTIVGDMQGLHHFAKEKKSAKRSTFGALLVKQWAPRRLAHPED